MRKPVNKRVFHTKGCSAACYQCLRFGHGVPCTTSPGKMKISCPDCHFTFSNEDCFNYHKLEEIPGQQRKVKSLCQQRYVCELCWKVVYTRGRRHVCGQNINNNDEICEICGGSHQWNMPCFIQPISVDKLNSLLQKRRRPIKNPRSIDITETDDETDEDDMDEGEGEKEDRSTSKFKPKPYRYFVFDIECTQDEEVQPGRFKHHPLLVCAELICTECITAGVKIDGTDNPPRPDKCICRGAGFINHRVRRWVVPDSDGRKFRFHNFDDATINPFDEMLNFLCNHGPKETNTLALSHNGIFL